MCCFTIPTLVGGGSVCFSILCPSGFCGCRNNCTFTVTKPCVFGSLTKSCLGFAPSSSEHQRAARALGETHRKLLSLAGKGKNGTERRGPGLGFRPGGSFPAEGPSAAPPGRQPRSPLAWGASPKVWHHVRLS